MRIVFLVLLVLVVGLVPVLAVEADTEEKPAEPTGKTVFVKSKCALCHTVYAEGIGEAPKEGDETAEGDEEAAAGEEGGSDGLSDLSTFEASHRKLDWLRLFLIEKEEIDGVKHVMGFKGTEEEWAALSGWLLSLGAPADTTEGKTEIPAESAIETGTQTSE